MTTTQMSLPDAIELSEKMKHAARARWTEERLLDETSGEVVEIQYDLTLDLKNSKETLTFRYCAWEDDDPRAWYFQILRRPEDGEKSWKDRHEAVEDWQQVPDMIGKLLWDVMTVHGEDAAKRGWSDVQSAAEAERRQREADEAEKAKPKILQSPEYSVPGGLSSNPKPRVTDTRRQNTIQHPGGWTEVR